MSVNNEIEKLLSETQLFLKQQAEMYGEELLLPSSEKTNMKNPQKEQAKPLIASEPETDLFGNPLQPVPSRRIQSYNLSAITNESWGKTSSLDELNASICNCQKCGLGKTRTKFVFGVGNPKAEIVVVGEAPGADEDAQGEPFVGRAGQLLNKILEAIHFRREEVYICNILKCRPPNNRDPQANEIEQCEPYLWKQLELIKPKMILCAGRIAGQALLKTNASLAELRSTMHNYRGIPLMVTYHPAALLRNPHWKRPCWEDVQKFRKLYDELNTK